MRAFVVIVAIQGNDPKLMPDLSAAVDVDVASRAPDLTLKTAPRKMANRNQGVARNDQTLPPAFDAKQGMAIVILVLAGSGVVLGAVRLGKRTPTVPTYRSEARRIS